MKDENNISKGHGFVRMKNHEDAAKAVQDLNGCKIDGLWNSIVVVNTYLYTKVSFTNI